MGGIASIPCHVVSERPLGVTAGEAANEPARARPGDARDWPVEIHSARDPHLYEVLRRREVLGASRELWTHHSPPPVHPSPCTASSVSPETRAAIVPDVPTPASITA